MMQRQPVSLLPVLGELAVVGGAALAALFWIIPEQTTADPFVALQPSLVPNVCATAILVLILIQAWNAMRKGRAQQAETAGDAAQEHSWRSALGAMAITVAGVLAFHLAGLLATSLIVVPGLMLWLGERRYLRIAIVALCCALPFTPLFN